MNLILRPFKGEEDHPCIAAILTASQNADGLPVIITPIEVAQRLNATQSFNPFRDQVIVEVDGQEVAYARVRWEDETSRYTYKMAGYILPEWRRKGIGQRLLTWLERRSQQISNEHHNQLPGYFHVNVTQYQAGLHALLQKNGYWVKESWVLMARPSLEEIPEAPLPEGLEVRPALPEHYAAIWHAVEEAYVPEGGPPPTGMMPSWIIDDPNFQPELWQVAWDIHTGKVVGSVMTYINHIENRQLGIKRGYTEGISTVPAWQRKGVAKALIARSLIAQRAASMTESALVCNVEKPNNARLYVNCGFLEVKRDTVYEKLLGLLEGNPSLFSEQAPAPPLSNS